MSRSSKAFIAFVVILALCVSVASLAAKKPKSVEGVTSGQGPAETINISLTNTGIHKTVGTAPSGLYALKITNNSTRSRGLVITGNDLCCSPYTRFSQLLRPGQSQIFRWFFAPGKVQFRDFTGGVRTSTSWTKIRHGGHASSLVFDEI